MPGVEENATVAKQRNIYQQQEGVHPTQKRQSKSHYCNFYCQGFVSLFKKTQSQGTICSFLMYVEYINICFAIKSQLFESDREVSGDSLDLTT